MNLPDALKLLHQQFPNAFVTSGARDPNSALGRANPRSYHNHGQAFDIRPMQGVDFNTYVSSLKNAGLPVVEALDEQRNPKPWTTGPNWHIAFGQKEERKPMLTPEQRAGMFNVNIPDEAQPFNLQAALSNLKLPGADVGQGISDALSANEALGKQKASKGSVWAAVLGAISDGLLALNNQQPIYAPMMARRNELDQEQNFARERLQAEMDARREELQAKLQEPPQFVQNLRAYQALPEDQQRAYLSYLDATNPIAVSGPQGTQRVPRTMPPRVGAVEEGYVFLGGDPADKNNWRPQ